MGKVLEGLQKEVGLGEEEEGFDFLNNYIYINKNIYLFILLEEYYKFL